MRKSLVALLGVTWLLVHGAARSDDLLDKAVGMAGFICIDSYAGALETPRGKAMAADPTVRDYLKFFKEDFGTCFTRRAWLSPMLCDELLRLDFGPPRDDETAKRVTRGFQARHEAELRGLDELISCMNAEEAKTWGRRQDK